MNRRGFLKALGLGGIVSAVAAPEVLRRFDPTVAVVDEGSVALALPSTVSSLPKARQSFQYLLGHDQYGRIFLHNLLNGEWIMYQEKTKSWVLSCDPYKLPPPT